MIEKRGHANACGAEFLERSRAAYADRPPEWIEALLDSKPPRLAEAGRSANEIVAISGHANMKELVRYTAAAADQARLARNAMARTAIVGRESIRENHA
jgi:hypothetical protein